MTRDEVVREMARALQRFPLCTPTYPKTRTLEEETADRMICAALADAKKHGWHLLNIENDWAFMAVVTQLPLKRRQAFYRAVKEMVNDAGDGE